MVNGGVLSPLLVVTLNLRQAVNFSFLVKSMASFVDR